LTSIIVQRELGLINFRRYPTARYGLMNRLLSEEGQVVASSDQSTFCGQFSDDGQRFISACQDFCIRVYDTSSSQQFKLVSEIHADDIGWSILDTALSNDRSSLSYSTWSDCIYLVKITDDSERPSVVSPLHIRTHAHNFAIFSLQYSADGSEIICGSNDTCVYIYDLQQQRRILQVEAHRNDVNAVRFVDNSNALIVSGSDDGLVSVWDRRALNEVHPKPVGVFAGHMSGITFVHSRMDTRYLISNSKDQTIKLWDMRRFADETTINKSLERSNAMSRIWDYRIGAQPLTLQRGRILGDPSVQTYRGHSVAYTLIRCFFSPAFNTGQRYIVTGSSDGSVYIYDVLTGTVEQRLPMRNSQYGAERDRCIRDVSWHPFENYIVSTSWDNRRAHVRWVHRPNSTDPSLAPPSDNKSAMNPPSSLPSLSAGNRPSVDFSFLQRLLLHQFRGNEYMEHSDEESSNGE